MEERELERLFSLTSHLPRSLSNESHCYRTDMDRRCKVPKPFMLYPDDPFVGLVAIFIFHTFSLKSTLPFYLVEFYLIYISLFYIFVWNILQFADV